MNYNLTFKLTRLYYLVQSKSLKLVILAQAKIHVSNSTKANGNYSS